MEPKRSNRIWPDFGFFTSDSNSSQLNHFFTDPQYLGVYTLSYLCYYVDYYHRLLLPAWTYLFKLLRICQNLISKDTLPMKTPIKFTSLIVAACALSASAKAAIITIADMSPTSTTVSGFTVSSTTVGDTVTFSFTQTGDLDGSGGGGLMIR